MRRIVKTGIFVGATASVLISGTLASYASWVLPGSSPAATVRTPSMPSGVTPNSKTITDGALVTWPAQKLSGVKMTAYVVTAHDTDETPLPSIARTVTASGSEDESVTFTSAELAGGKWKWAIAPKLQSWTGPEGALSNPKLIFGAPTPATALAKAVTTGTSIEAPQAATSPATSGAPTPTPTSTTAAPVKNPGPDPTPSPTEKESVPAKMESPKADPSVSESSAAPAESYE
jgi:hypothetical protein